MKFILILFLLTSLTFAYPSVFPTGVTINEEGAYDGYTLFSPKRGDKSLGTLGVVYLIDMNGNVVNTWKTDFIPGTNAFLLPNGNLIFAGETNTTPKPGSGKGGIIQEFDWDGNVVWEYKNDLLHHTFERLPNGNTLLLAWELVPEELVKKIGGGVENIENTEAVWGEMIFEIDTKGNTIWEWHSHEHLDFDFYVLDSISSFWSSTNQREWLHANEIEYLPNNNAYNGREGVLASFRETNTVVIIDKETKNVTWVWGKGKIDLQHDPSLLDNGNIMIFDNGVHREYNGSGNFIHDQPRSRVVEVNPETNEIVWQYTGSTLLNFDFLTPVMGGAQKLPNGNTLITESLTGRIFEITDTKDIVWEYVSPYKTNDKTGNSMFKAHRYGPNDINWPVELDTPKKINLKNTGLIHRLIDFLRDLF